MATKDDGAGTERSPKAQDGDEVGGRTRGGAFRRLLDKITGKGSGSSGSVSAGKEAGEAGAGAREEEAIGGAANAATRLAVPGHLMNTQAGALYEAMRESEEQRILHTRDDDMLFREERVEDIVVLTAPVVGYNDPDPTEGARKLLFAAMNRPETRGVLIDLANVRFAASAFLGLLVGTTLRAEKEGKRCAICSVDRLIQDLIKRLELDRVLTIYPSRSEAMEAMLHP